MRPLVAMSCADERESVCFADAGGVERANRPYVHFYDLICRRRGGEATRRGAADVKYRLHVFVDYGNITQKSFCIGFVIGVHWIRSDLD